MRLIILFLSVASISSIGSTSKQINKNSTPICRNCIHFRPWDLNTNMYDNNLHKCSYHKTENIITGVTIYEYAESCRKNEAKCGIEGKHFELAKNLEIKNAISFIQINIVNIIFFTVAYINFSVVFICLFHIL